MKNISGIILAGGRSTRMGADKAALAMSGIPLLERAAGLLTPFADDIVVVTRDRTKITHPIRVIPDEIPDRGPVAGLLSGLHAVRHARAIVIPVDLPLLTPGFLKYLIESSYGWDLTIPRWRDGMEPLVGVYAVGCGAALAASLSRGEDSLQSFILTTDLSVRFLEEPEIRQFGDPSRLFLNVNTPEDASLAESFLADTSGSSGQP